MTGVAAGGPGPMTPVPSPPPVDRAGVAGTPSSLSKNGKAREELDKENETMTAAEEVDEATIPELDEQMIEADDHPKSPTKPTQSSRTSAVTRPSKAGASSNFNRDDPRDVSRSKMNARRGPGKSTDKIFTGNDGIQEKILDKDYYKIEFDLFAEYDNRPRSRPVTSA